MIDIPLTALHPHPQNPRLTIREDVVQQIAAQICALGKFDPAHALLVRPREDGESYEIISGFHRMLAVKQAGLAAVPCWVREMDDQEAMVDPFKDIANFVRLARDVCDTPEWSLQEQASCTTVFIAFRDQAFTGERIFPQTNKIDWLSTWVDRRFLPDTLAFWDIPVDPDFFTWHLSPGAYFMRANGGMFALNTSGSPSFPTALPDGADEPAFQRYVGTDCVYFVQAQQLKLIKIGFSSNVGKRLAALKTGCPDRLELLNILPGGPALEKTLHQRFAQQRVHGEWFTPTAAMITFILNGSEA